MTMFHYFQYFIQYNLAIWLIGKASKLSWVNESYGWDHQSRLISFVIQLTFRMLGLLDLCLSTVYPTTKASVFHKYWRNWSKSKSNKKKVWKEIIAVRLFWCCLSRVSKTLAWLEELTALFNLDIRWQQHRGGHGGLCTNGEVRVREVEPDLSR